jgi:hypothetical protein
LFHVLFPFQGFLYNANIIYWILYDNAGHEKGHHQFPGREIADKQFRVKTEFWNFPPGVTGALVSAGDYAQGIPLAFVFIN